jgi:hypothetical protein
VKPDFHALRLFSVFLSLNSITLSHSRELTRFKGKSENNQWKGKSKNSQWKGKFVFKPSQKRCSGQGTPRCHPKV